MAWHKKMLKHNSTNAKLLAWLGCIVKKVEITLRSFCFWSKNTVEANQPVDYEKKHWHKYDWQKWVNDNKDKWD